MITHSYYLSRRPHPAAGDEGDAMKGTETTIVRTDADNKPLSVNVETGRVERPNSYYPTPLKGEAAWRLFLDLAALVHSAECPAFIRACNRVAARKTPATDAERRGAVCQIVGISPMPVRCAKPHAPNCSCPPCLTKHVLAGCRVVGCKACFA